MRVKNDFVTNSSSTCFLFAFKGPTRKDLYKAIRNHEMSFLLGMDYDGYHSLIPEEEDGIISCNASAVIDALKSVRNKTKIITIEEKLDEIRKEIKTWQRYGENRYAYYIYNCFSRIAILMYAKEHGINNVLEVCFGDNDGPFAGTKIGLLMDYEGRNIEVMDTDLVVLTEQRR